MTEEMIKQLKNSDVECLRCGARNIPENRICGACGASLPLVYDQDGNVFNWRGDPRLENLLHHGASRRILTPRTAGWLLRLLVILSALFTAFLILHH